MSRHLFQRATILSVALLTLMFITLAQDRAYCQEEQIAGGPVTINDLLAEVGNRVPAFGGFFTENATLYVYMVPREAGDLAEANRALNDVLGADRPQQPRISAVQGQYTFTQLMEWNKSAVAVLLNVPGAVAMGIDYSRNRIFVGVQDLELAPAVKTELTALGIPHEAVNIEEMGPFNPARTLQDYWRPDIGGLQINYSTPMGSFVCTHWLAYRNGVEGFVTNSHCSRMKFGLDGQIYYQPEGPVFPVPSQIGQETVDPPVFQRGACPVLGGWVISCRFSDSNFSKFSGIRDGVIVGGFTRGFIADPSPPLLNNINWNGVTRFTITAQGDPVMPDFVDKVGRTTGLTQGPVDFPCGLQLVAINRILGTATFLLCQYTVHLTTNQSLLGGDSGSPVFKETGGGNVKLEGIAWGSNHCTTCTLPRNCSSPGPPDGCPPGQVQCDVCPAKNCIDPNQNSPLNFCQMVFSPINGVQNPADLGPLLVCAGGGC